MQRTKLCRFLENSHCIYIAYCTLEGMIYIAIFVVLKDAEEDPRAKTFGKFCLVVLCIC